MVTVDARANRAAARGFNDKNDVFIKFQFRMMCSSMMITELIKTSRFTQTFEKYYDISM